MKLLVCGGRDYSHKDHIWNVLSVVHGRTPITMIAHGGASGADSEAGRWAIANHVRQQIFRANWKAEGRAAGPKRNQRMLEQFRPDAVIAFPGGRGTADMVRRAKAEGVKVVQA